MTKLQYLFVVLLIIFSAGLVVFHAPIKKYTNYPDLSTTEETDMVSIGNEFFEFKTDQGGLLKAVIVYEYKHNGTEKLTPDTINFLLNKSLKDNLYILAGPCKSIDCEKEFSEGALLGFNFFKDKVLETPEQDINVNIIVVDYEPVAIKN